MTERPELRFCRRCALPEADKSRLAETIAEYIGSLPAEEKAEPGEYRRRLAECERCPHRMEITCSLCGCFVPVRAVRRSMRCPDTDGPRW